jgi:signal transduction histidine kinase
MIHMSEKPTYEELLKRVLEFEKAELENKRNSEALHRSQVMMARTERIANVGSWEWDISTDKVTWSEELFRIFQLDPNEKVPSWAEHSALYHPEDMESLRHAVEASVADGTPYELELRALRKDGEIRVCLACGFAETGPDGRAMRLFGSLQDITERKQTEQEKAKLEGQLQRAQKMESIGSLAGGIAHDLNNILFPISGLSEMLLEEIPPENPVHESIEQIHKSAQRGGELVKQILAFSRQSNPQKLPIRIQPILKEALKLAQATIPRNIEITSHIDTDCGMVSADPTQVHQIMMNLITNAFHAVEQTGGTIHIAMKETIISSFGEKDKLPFHAIPGGLLAGRYACITVYDTGT